MMKKLACLSAALALFAGCGMLGLGGGGDDEDKPAAKPEARPEDERSKKQDEAKPAVPAPAPEAKPSNEKPYEPPDFPAPWTDSPQALQGDFWKGKELLGVDPYRSPDATGGQRGYYFGFPEVVVEAKVAEKKTEDKKKK